MKPRPANTHPQGRRTDVKLRLGIAVKRRRNEMGIPQEELAERAGLHRTYISDIERGSRNPSLESIEKLALALDIPMPELFERMAEPVVAKDVFFSADGGNNIGKENSAPERQP